MQVRSRIELMKHLVLFYSLTGNNHRLAEELAKKKNCDLIEFSPGSLLRVFTFFFGKTGLVKKAKKLDLKDYDTIYLCGPIWAQRPAPALLAVLKNSDLRDKRVNCYFTYTQNYGNTDKMVKELLKSSGAHPGEVKFINISS